jgi:hypothetical protein
MVFKLKSEILRLEIQLRQQVIERIERPKRNDRKTELLVTPPTVSVAVERGARGRKPGRDDATSPGGRSAEKTSDEPPPTRNCSGNVIDCRV